MKTTKTILILFAVTFTLTTCSGKKQTDAQESENLTSDSLSLEQETMQFGDNYTVEDMFLLLPDDAFNGAYPQTIRRKMVENKDEYVDEYGKLRYDADNDILYVDGEANFPASSIYFRKLPNGKRLVTTLNRIENDWCELNAYWFENDKLVPDKNFYAYVNENFKFTGADFFDFDKVPKEIAENFEFYPSRIDYTVNFSDNGLITVIADSNYGEYEGEEGLQDAQYIIKFERVADKWTKKRIKKPKIIE